MLRRKHGGPAPTSMDPSGVLLFLVLRHLCSTSLCLEISSAFPNPVLSDRSPSFCTVRVPCAHSEGSASIFDTYCVRDDIPCRAGTVSMHKGKDQATRCGPMCSELVSSGLGEERDAECNLASHCAHLPDETGALQVPAEFWAGLCGLTISEPKL